MARLIQKPIRIRPATFVALEEEAGRDGNSASSMVRAILEDYVNDLLDVDIEPEPPAPVFGAMVEPEVWRAAVAKAKANGVTIAEIIEAVYG